MEPGEFVATVVVSGGAPGAVTLFHLFRLDSSQPNQPSSSPPCSELLIVHDPPRS